MLNTYIVSSNIARVGWSRNTLYIEFNSGTRYAYDHVPIKDYWELVKAESVGQHFHQNIRKTYQYTKIDYDPFTEKGVNARVETLEFHNLPEKKAA